jgi:hypothetical protein
MEEGNRLSRSFAGKGLKFLAKPGDYIIERKQMTGNE